MYNIKQKTMNDYTINLKLCSNGRNYTARCEQDIRINDSIFHHDIEWYVWHRLKQGYTVNFNVESLKNKM
tara:strand:- start:1055 stop:1264 length:210 start_codon:yes stop_codon:yes gene_type:complete